jgi:hypothetical protein
MEDLTNPQIIEWCVINWWLKASCNSAVMGKAPIPQSSGNGKQDPESSLPWTWRVHNSQKVSEEVESSSCN